MPYEWEVDPCGFQVPCVKIWGFTNLCLLKAMVRSWDVSLRMWKSFDINASKPRDSSSRRILHFGLRSAPKRLVRLRVPPGL